jgi:hypothetical protein
MSEQGREANGDGDAVKTGPPKTYQQACAQTDSFEAPHETNSLRTDKAAPQNPPLEAPPPPRQPGRMSTDEAPPAQGEFDPDQVRRLIALIKGERLTEMPAKASPVEPHPLSSGSYAQVVRLLAGLCCIDPEWRVCTHTP